MEMICGGMGVGEYVSHVGGDIAVGADLVVVVALYIDWFGGEVKV